MRYTMLFLSLIALNLGCKSDFEKSHTIKTNVNTLSKDNVKIDFEYSMIIEFYGDEPQYDKLSADYNSNVEYGIRAMSTSLIRMVIGWFTVEEINKEIPKEEIEKAIENYLNQINFKIVEFNIYF